MENTQEHEIELYPPETFRTLLEHEVNKSHRYGDSLSLIDLVVEQIQVMCKLCIVQKSLRLIYSTCTCATQTFHAKKEASS